MIDFDKICRAIQAFRKYGDDVEESFITPRAELFANLSECDRRIIGELGIWNRKEMALRQAINANAELAKSIAEYSVDFLNSQGCEDELRRLDNEQFEPTNEEKAIARSAIRQIWRDWSSEATAERNACFSPIVEDIAQRYYRRDRSGVKILIPGSGLNRLGFNLSRAGYDVEANEVSYIHLLATNFILSRTNDGRGICLREGFLGNIESEGAQSVFTVCPWALSFSNHAKTEHQFTSYTVPEIMPASSTYLGSPPTLDTSADTLAFKAPRFSLNGNNFMKDYTDSSVVGQYDVIITCFFIDTAPNFLSYVRTIKHLLKPGGTWINIGPLLWNCYENGPGGRREGDIDIDENTQARQQPQPLRPIHQDPGEQWDRKLEFSHEEVMAILEEMGFCKHQDQDVGTAGYCFDTRGMMNMEYKLRFWVAVKGMAIFGHPNPKLELKKEDEDMSSTVPVAQVATQAAAHAAGVVQAPNDSGEETTVEEDGFIQ